MTSEDTLLRFVQELVIKGLIVAIGVVGKSAFDSSVAHAIYARWQRRGFFAAIESAIRSFVSACVWRIERAGVHPFRGFDWEAALVSSPGVSRKAQQSDSARMRGKYYYQFENVRHSMTSEKHARAGGFPIFERVIIGRDRASRSWVAAISLQCGGTAGILTIAVFAETNAGPRLVDVIQQGDKQCCFFSKGALHVSTPVRDPDEPNCSWRRTRIARYAVSGEGVRKAWEAVLTTAHFRRAYRDALARTYGGPKPK
jgi:hypothetical protein